MNDERLRIVILNYNRAKLTLDCVRSVMEQKYDGFDIVVVDNASELEEFEILSRDLPPGITLVRADANLGYAAGNNLGLRLSNLPPAKYLMVLNNDVTLPDRFTSAKLVQALERDGERVACSPLVDTISSGGPPEEQIQVRRLPRFATVLIASSWWLRRLPWLRQIAQAYVYHDLVPYPTATEIDCDSINGSCFVVSSSFLKEIGYLDESTFLYEEEIILAHQMRTRRKKGCLVTSTTVLHEQGATSGQQRGRVRLDLAGHLIRSQIHYCRKYLRCSSVQIGLLVLVRALDTASKLVYQVISDSLSAFNKPLVSKRS